MAQLFGPYADAAVRAAVFALGASPVLLVGANFAVTRSPFVTGEGLTSQQPIPFSHQHHVGFDGLDCRYCHYGVERSSWAGVPPTEVCMTCHSQLFADARVLAPARESLAKDEPIAWTRVHALPDYVYFDHAVHIAKGVGCSTCHGKVGDMPLTRQATPMTMEWCISCHRDPAPNLRKREDAFDDSWTPAADQREQGRKLMAAYHIDVGHLTDCSVCHR